MSSKCELIKVFLFIHIYHHSVWYFHEKNKSKKIPHYYIYFVLLVAQILSLSFFSFM